MNSIIFPIKKETEQGTPGIMLMILERYKKSLQFMLEWLSQEPILIEFIFTSGNIFF